MKLSLTRYACAKSNGAILDLQNRALLEVTGKDAVSFLHRMLTNDIKNIKSGSGCFACLLNAQAKIIADMNVFVADDKVLIAMENSIVTKTIGALEKFTVMDDVKFSDKSKELSILAIMGPKSEEVVKSLFPGVTYPKEIFEHAAAKIKNFDCYLVCISLFGFKTWCFVVSSKDKNNILELVKNAAKQFGISQIDKETVQILRVESGTPKYGVDLTEEIILPEVKLIEPRAVSFTKGCYPGQEIVARIDSRGKFAKQLTGIAMAGGIIPNSGDKIEKSGKPIGWITSAVFSPALSKPLALGFVASDHLSLGTEIEIKSGNQNILGVITKLPVLN